MNRIVALIDFTGVAFVAADHAALIAREDVTQVVLLHVAEEVREKDEMDLHRQIKDYAVSLEREGIPYTVQIRYGTFFDVISDCLKELKTDLLVVGTHGIKGIKQNFLSSNILKLLRLIDVPSLIVQAHSEVPHEGYTNLLLPMQGLMDTAQLTPPVKKFSEIFNSTVNILAFYNPENDAELHRRAKVVAEGIARPNNTPTVEFEECSVYTSSYSKNIIQYADIEGAQVIALVIHEPDGVEYFDAWDKENILLNRLGMAVLCI